MKEHGSDWRRFMRGEWAQCVCGYAPKDNDLLNKHYAEHGFEEVDNHGRLEQRPLP